MEERIKHGICVLWKRPSVDDHEVPMDVETPEDEDYRMAPEEHIADESAEDQVVAPSRHSLVDADYDDEELRHQIKEHADVDDPLKASLILSEALDAAAEVPIAEIAEVQLSAASVAPKIEDVDDSAALRELANSGADEMDIDSAVISLDTEAASKTEETDTLPEAKGLKDGSKNPTLNAHPESQVATANSWKEMSEHLKSLREPIAFLPERALFVDMDDLEPFREVMNNLNASEEHELALQPDLSDIFPDLQPLAMVDVSTSDIINSNGPSDGKKKADKKADKDDPTKRVEETTYTKLHPIGVFMHTKPTMVSALQPARKWRKGSWINLEESPVAGDADGSSATPSDESTCGTLRFPLADFVLIFLPQHYSTVDGKALCQLEPRSSSQVPQRMRANGGWRSRGPRPRIIY